MFRKFNKYFKIYWTTIFCLLALCITILMVTGYNSQKREKENEESLSQMTQFEQERKDLEFKVATVISLGRTLTEYDCVKKFAADNNIYDKMNFANVNEVSTVLAANQLDFDSLGLDIHLFKEIGDVIIAPLQTYDVDEFEEINNITKDDIVNIFADDNLKYSYKIIPRMEQEGTMMFVFRRTYSQFNKIYGLVYFKGANIRCVQSYDNQIVFIGDKCKDNNFKKLKLKDLIEDAVYRQKLDDKEHNVYGVLKNYPDMIYLTSYLFEEVGTIRTIYIILYLLTVIFAFLVSFYITKVIYKPIASLINIFGGDVMTSYDEFAFLSQEVRKNLNINNDLILELDNIKRERKYKFLYDLLNGFVWGDGISKSINQYNLLFLCNRCNVVMFEFRLSSASSSSDGFYVIDGYTSLLYLELEKILKDKILEKWIDDENRAICIIADVEDLEDDINNVVENMSKKEVFVVAAISNIIDNPQEYRNVYDSLSRLLKYSFVVGKNVLTQERDEIYSAWEYYTIEQESQLEEFIINGQYEKALFILRRILSGFRYDRELKEDDEYKFKTMIVLNTIRFLKQSGLKLLKIENDLLNLRENVTIDRNDFCEEMLGVYKNIIKGFDINAENSNQIGEQIVEYLKQNYMKDISMDDVCDMFGVSASTVTRKLDEMYGIKFKTYLTELRIEKAKKIIKTNPAYKIKDIAEMVGFNNALSFGRAFNRVEGISVGDYIKRIK